MEVKEVYLTMVVSEPGKEKREKKVLLKDTDAEKKIMSSQNIYTTLKS